ncbi:2-oxoacid:ferredoxin oxidoreductase subunit beta [Kineosporia sp. J2-2]|uniref:2-oxoacid:ferredoxin oxidoreductase subunit beta n=1 Tax=Kineosporia corallincola TaxID=2835133 RepID=A0ABS5TC61_9ACTN|nr:2-oxoacid:ferredoxin oxidoreductase subunit beta [Kineosporia corallincola]MBT0767786.1 2-oxoacid:ferredoxin oxidoreductase subunit beta [Kineosporia corallincola]
MTTELGMPTVLSGLAQVPHLGPDDAKQTRKDFTSGAEVRWCPGCGDYAILAAVQGFMPELGIRRENVVCVSGIGCSSRFPYYLDTYGLHSIHGRAPSIATGLVTARPDLNVWVVTGDGDALSIGGNHLIHALRRNVNLTVLLFNNRIYGLTKGQYSPTSEPGKITKSTPVGSVDTPFNPISLALGAEATFVARTLDSDRKHLTSVLKQAVEHRGSALVEIYQNCPIFNDGAFDVLKDRDEAQARLIRLEHGEPIRFGADGAKGVVRAADGSLEVADVSAVGEAALLVHDAENPNPATQFALSRLDDATLSHVPLGVFRKVARPAYDDLVRAQVAGAVEANSGPATDDDLAALLAGQDTWTVSD